MPKGVVREYANPPRGDSKGANHFFGSVRIVPERIDRVAFSIGVTRDERVAGKRSRRAIGRMQKREALSACFAQTSRDRERIRSEWKLSAYEHGECC